MPAASLEIHFLDVGANKYGDSILVRHGSKSIFIDGAHKEDFDGQQGYRSLPDQLRDIFGTAPPYAVDLLVLTHCHNDHIGCLPELVAENVIRASKAYVADEKLGWGLGLPDSGDPRISGILDLLREEDASTLKRSELDAALSDAAALRNRLVRMFRKLADNGTEVIRCDGDEDRQAIEAAFAEIGLRILGPTKPHLRLCAEQIREEQRDTAALLNQVLARDAAATSWDLLQRVTDRRLGEDGLLTDGFKEGFALNCQSIIFGLEFGGRKVLLAGDMQFAEPGVDGLGSEMTALRQEVKDFGPYDLIKTCHHSSHNGWNNEVAAEQVPASGRVFVVHSGGLRDPSHPNEEVLRKIRNLRTARGGDLTWLRTDRNGRVAFTISPSGEIRYTKSKGRVNNFQPNDDDAVASPSITHTTTRAEGDYVEVVTRIPNGKTRVTITVEIDQPNSVRITDDEEIPRSEPVSAFSLPRDRQIPPLLFVTDEQALGRKIGANHARAAVAAIESSGQRVFNDRLAGRSAVEAASQVRSHLQNGIEGVVLLGGPDVVPSLRLDVLGPDLRPQLEDPESEDDNFIVWNDELYGDRDGDQLAELPVSRIADGASPQLVAAALAARSNGRQSRFGVRNVRRPFAELVFRPLPGAGTLNVSQPTTSQQIRPRDVEMDFVYLMLHGDDSDGEHFWGETNAALLEAFSVDQVPASFSGVVFTGCCYGALTTTRRALQFNAGDPITCRTARDGIALRFLAAGALAYVGCTGVHYSPRGNSTSTAGGPMHMAFFNRLLGGDPPARALFNAKRDCLGQLDPNTGPEELGVSLKIIRQFTCLGLGW